jgi:signal transduction histidine kinase
MSQVHPPEGAAKGTALWYRRLRDTLGHSIKLRLLLVFLLLALAMAFTFISGAQRAFTEGWREAARPLLMDYVDRLVEEVAAGGTPSVERASAITQRLPLTITIQGPQVQWSSHPPRAGEETAPDRPADDVRQDREGWGGDKEWQRLLTRSTADGHRIGIGINKQAFERQTHLVGYTLTALLVLTLLAFLYLRHLLRPLDAIGAGARRFGLGDFSQPIPVRRPNRPDELGQLAGTINTMGQDIREMLDAKRALLLAISHELRSPLTRARLNTELLPETPEVTPQRDALRRDLQEMTGLITDLLESERLAARHAALHREPVVLPELAREVIAELKGRHHDMAPVLLYAAADLPTLWLDPTRMRLLLRNLLDNALRHGAGAAQPAELRLQPDGAGIRITVRDHGPGVPQAQLPHLAEPFFRPDSARSRPQGGVGLGLYLCKLVAQAHGGTFALHNAGPGLEITVRLGLLSAPG